MRYIDGCGDGDTVYVGSRSSALYIRIYDKWRESKLHDDWRYAWRFEAEVKEGVGAQYWEGPRNSLPSTAYWAAIVVSMARERGITLPVLLPGEMGDPQRIPRGETDNEKRLRWLARQVAPTVEKLRASGVSDRLIARALTGDDDPAIMARMLADLAAGNSIK